MKEMEKELRENFERVEFGRKAVWLPRPDVIPESKLVGREKEITNTLAAWTTFGGLPPLNFRLYGPPGVGKNAIVYELARILKKDIYILQGHDELTPENIACTGTFTSDNRVEYVASKLFAGMYKGGIVFFDEIGKAPSSALDPLASVLDDRRVLTSVLAGIHIKAHPDFLFCAALNEIEEKGTGLKDFLDERTRPAIHVGYPSVSEMEKILERHFPKEAELWIKVFIEEFKDIQLSPRNAITFLGYAYRLYKSKQDNGSGLPEKNVIKKYLHCLKKDMGLEDANDGEETGRNEEKEEMINEMTEFENDFYSKTESKGPVH